MLELRDLSAVWGVTGSVVHNRFGVFLANPVVSCPWCPNPAAPDIQDFTGWAGA